jgi:hypothetical protein
MRLLSAFISWLNDQPAGTQGLVFAALAIAASVGGKVLTTGASALWGVTRRKYSSWQESRESGEPLPSKIGLYDRAVNAAAALQRLPEAITTVGEHYHRIVEKHEARRRHRKRGGCTKEVRTASAVCQGC